MLAARPFEVNIPQPVLDDLGVRLAATRLTPHDRATDWEAGASPAFQSDAACTAAW